MNTDKRTTDSRWIVPALAAITAAVYMLTTPSIGRFPSFPGAPGLPLFYVPPIAYLLARLLMRGLTDISAKRVTELALLLIAGGCAWFCFGALSTPFHRECVEGVRLSSQEFECDRYALRPGADLEAAALWGGSAAVAVWLLRIQRRAADRD